MGEARRHGVPQHKVAAFVRRRLGGGVAVVRLRADGSPGCSAPCTLCARELARFDLKVCCCLESGALWVGLLTDPGAPPAKVTGGQCTWLTHWVACRDKRAPRPPGSGSGDAAAPPTRDRSTARRSPGRRRG